MILKQKGAAIIVALFVMSLVAIAAVAMIEHLQIMMRRTTLIDNDVRATFYSQGMLAFAMDQLNQDVEKQQANKVVDLTPIRLPTSQVEGATIEGVINDAEGRFNINNLTDAGYRDDFVRLIQAVVPSIEASEAKQLMQNVVEWVTTVNLNDDYYATLEPAYRVPHHKMQSVSELRLVKGFDAKLYQALSPYLIALPETTPVNINNAEPLVLMSLSKTLTLNSANSIVHSRTQSPYVSKEAFFQSDIVKNNPFPEAKVTVLSSYFLVITSVTVGQQTSLMYTLLARTQDKKKSTLNIVWQSKGTL